MPSLNAAEAKRLAWGLITIGHPFQELAVEATAVDLIEMCQGMVVDGRVVITPIEQAEALIREARNWPDGWPDRGGTHRLRSLFEQKYGPKPVELPPASAAVLVSRGLLAPPCRYCEEGDEYCAAGGPKAHALARELEARVGLEMAGKPKFRSNVEPLTEEQMRQAIADEERRRTERRMAEEELAKLAAVKRNQERPDEISDTPGEDDATGA